MNKSLFPALEKALPRHRRLMNRLYNRPLATDLTSLTDDEFTIVMAEFEKYNMWQTARNLIRNRVELPEKAIFANVSPMRAWSVVSTSASGTFTELVFRANRDFYAELGCENATNIRTVLEEIDGCVAGRYVNGVLTIWIDDDRLAVKAKLRLADFIHA